MAWYDGARRDLPWRRTRDPWHILVSEVMLQQTRVQAVIPYYQRFLARFPTPQALAEAPESEVLVLWSGLGYYSRARRLRQAARAISAAPGFPRTYTGLRALPGLGDYTAAAVASIAFGQAHAAVDGNVLRVVARITNNASGIGAAGTRRAFQKIASGWLDASRPGDFNQAMMELGATVCLPRAPLCPSCPLGGVCRARTAGTQAQLPVKLGAAPPEAVELQVVVACKPGYLLLGQRGAAEPRLAGFWELPEPGHLPAATPLEPVARVRHAIVNQLFRVTVLRCGPVRAPRGYRWISAAEAARLPLTTLTRKALATLS